MCQGLIKKARDSALGRHWLTRLLGRHWLALLPLRLLGRHWLTRLLGRHWLALLPLRLLGQAETGIFAAVASLSQMPWRWHAGQVSTQVSLEQKSK